MGNMRAEHKIKRCLLWILAGSMIFGVLVMAQGEEPLIGQHKYRLETQWTTVNYLLFLPKDYDADPEREWPLILFLHGAGKRGDNLDLLKGNSIPMIVEQKEDFPFIVVSPQCPATRVWSEGDRLKALNALLDEVIAEYAVDASRVYLTGQSMGGYGTWYLATAYPERFTAIAPLCGGGEVWKACALKDVPVWVFHGAKDPTVMPEESERMVEALKACGGDVKFTLYPDAFHDVWTVTYDNPELYEWFLQHPPLGTNVQPRDKQVTVWGEVKSDQL